MELWAENACREEISSSAAKELLRGEAALQRERVCRNALQLAVRSRPGGLTNHKLGFDGDLGNVFRAPFGEIDNGLRRDLPHLDQWLAHRCGSRSCVRRSRNLVATEDGT